MTQAFNLSQLANNVNTSGQLDASAGLYNTTPVANGGSGRSTLTSGSVLLGNGTSAVTMLAGAVTNDALVWNGTTWTATPLAAAGGGGGYSTTVITSPTSYTKPLALKAIKIFVIGGGGGGGGSHGASGLPNAQYSGAGGSSKVAWAYFPAASVPSSPITVTIGTGGTGGGAPGTIGSSTAGNPGTASSFGILATATGGGGGTAGTAPTQGTWGAIGTFSTPAPTSNYFVYIDPDNPPVIGAGRDVAFTMGYGGAQNGNAGIKGYGSGGGSYVSGNVATSSGSGYTGSNGLIIIEEYF